MDSPEIATLRKMFEQQARDSYGFKRSFKGVYVNPLTSRDWKWFRLGVEAAVASSLPAQGQPSEKWLPISTAPKDGTLVDLWMVPKKQADTPYYRAAPKPFRATDMWWDERRQEWVRKSFFKNRALQNYPAHEPSYWSPLPTPPAPSQETQA